MVKTLLHDTTVTLEMTKEDYSYTKIKIYYISN